MVMWLEMLVSISKKIAFTLHILPRIIHVLNILLFFSVPQVEFCLVDGS